MDISQSKAWHYQRALAELRGFGIDIVPEACNPNTLWGAYIRIDEASYAPFVQAYWDGVTVPAQTPESRLDPKLLIVAPGQRLSLQYHHRRSEYWRVVCGPVTVVTGADGDNLEEKIYNVGDVLYLPIGMWHRLIGLDAWGLVAEIWASTDVANPSDETDIVRISDDFGR